MACSAWRRLRRVARATAFRSASVVACRAADPTRQASSPAWVRMRTVLRLGSLPTLPTAMSAASGWSLRIRRSRKGWRRGTGVPARCGSPARAPRAAPHTPATRLAVTPAGYGCGVTEWTVPVLGPLAWIDAVLLGWFALTVVSVAYVAYDAWHNNPELTVLKWGWALLTLYLDPVGLAAGSPHGGRGQGVRPGDRGDPGGPSCRASARPRTPSTPRYPGRASASPRATGSASGSPTTSRSPPRCTGTAWSCPTRWTGRPTSPNARSNPARPSPTSSPPARPARSSTTATTTLTGNRRSACTAR